MTYVHIQDDVIMFSIAQEIEDDKVKITIAVFSATYVLAIAMILIGYMWPFEVR